MKISAKELKLALDSGQSLVLIDVRRQSDYDEDPNLIPGATWYDLEQMDAWSQDIPKDADLVVYCAHGRSRSQAALEHFTNNGYKVKLLDHGYDGWRDAGGTVVPT
jgi:rhodanese-related sulfurtransferase